MKNRNIYNRIGRIRIKCESRYENLSKTGVFTQFKYHYKIFLFFLIMMSGVLTSCLTSDRFVDPSVRHTGTANEPGTRIQPYPRADYEYNEQYSRKVEREFYND